MGQIQITNNNSVFLTVMERNVIGSLPVLSQEYIFAKFKRQISKYSDAELETSVSALILRTLVESGVKDQTNNEVVTFLSETLTEDLKHPKFCKITFEEITLALKKGVRREYGEYMGVNIQTIHSWIKAYMHSSDRTGAIKEFYNKVDEVENNNTSAKNTKPNPEGQKKVVEILRPFIEENKPRYSTTKFQPAEKSERDKFIQKCLSDFSDVVRKNPVKEDLTGRFAIIDGVVMDQIDYTKMKVKEWDEAQVKE